MSSNSQGPAAKKSSVKDLVKKWPRRTETHAPCCRPLGLTVHIECEQSGAVGDPPGRLEVRAEDGNTVIRWAV